MLWYTVYYGILYTLVHYMCLLWYTVYCGILFTVVNYILWYTVCCMWYTVCYGILYMWYTVYCGIYTIYRGIFSTFFANVEKKGFRELKTYFEHRIHKFGR